MNLHRFLDERRPIWEELLGLVSAASGKPERLGAARVRRLGSLYREAAADLALARRRYPSDPVVERLEDLVSRARLLVYDAGPRRGSLVSFFADTYWRLVARRPGALVMAALLLFAPAALAGSWALDDPGAAGGLVPPQFRAVTEPRPEGADLGLGAGRQAAFAGQIFTNNIRVSFLAFAGGITLGLLTAAVVMYNGVLLGTIGGLAVGAGAGGSFFELVAAHGVLELSCIVVTAAASLSMGWSIVEPGRGTRRASLAAEAGRAVQIVIGTAPWLVAAGLVEGFVTPAGLGLGPVVAIGFGMGSVYWALVWRRGRLVAGGA